MISRTLLLAFFLPLLAQGANLRGVYNNHHDAKEEAARERRRLEIQEIASYWTTEMVENAIPRDALITKERAQEIEQQRKQEKANHHHNRRHLTVYTENAKPAPARMDDETIHLVKVGNSVMECSLRHDPHEEEAAEGTTLRRRGLQQGSPPTEARISPKPGAVLHSSYIDFVVDVFDADDDLFWIAFYLNNHAAKAVSRTRFQPTHGNGQYTLRLGPFSSGGYEWSIRVRDQQAFHSDAGELEYDSFSVELPDGASPTMIFPTALADDLFSYHDPSRQPPNNLAPGPTTMAPPLTMTTATSPTGGTPGTSPSPPLVGGDVAELPPGVNSPTTDAAPPATIGTTPSTSQWTPPTSLQTPSTFVPPTTPQTPSTFIPPTTPASPPRTITPPTTYTPPTNSGGGSVNFVYHSPSTTGKTADPVTFEWEVTGAQVFVSLLYIKYPDGGETYLTRQPTATGRDTVTTALNEKGIYKWSIWAQSEVGSFQEGPWQTFEIEEGIPDPNCPEHLARFTDRNHDLHKAIGRILYTINGHNYLCSGTLVDGANDRAVIATAAHCMYDSETGSFPSKVMFIPGQDDGEGDSSDYNCFNDPHGCFYPTSGVISDKYYKASFGNGFQYDYSFYIAPDTDMGNNSGPDKDTFGGDAYKSLKPMGISFRGNEIGKNTYLYGYPGSRDPHFMYSEGRCETSPVTQGGWYVDCSRLTGGASGGPWTQTNPNAGHITVTSVNSWGWTDGDSGMGSPPFDTGGAECVYNAANAAAITGGYVVETCPE